MSDFAATRDFHRELRQSLHGRLPEFLNKQRWFGGKARPIRSTEIDDIVPLKHPDLEMLLLIVTVHYNDSSDEAYALPVIRREPETSSSEDGENIFTLPHGSSGNSRNIFDATQTPEFHECLLATIRDEASHPGEHGEIRGFRSSAFARTSSAISENPKARVLSGEQSNTSIIYGDRLILKLFRRLEEGVNPDLEIGNFLTETAHFAHIPALAGHLEYRTHGGPRRSMTQGILQAFVPNQGDAWRYTLKFLTQFYEQVAARREQTAFLALESRQRNEEPPEFALPLLEPYLSAAALLGKRTAELHLALSSDAHNPSFAPEPFTPEFQVAFRDTLAQLTAHILHLLRNKVAQLPAGLRKTAEDIAAQEHQIQRRFASLLNAPIRAMRARIHGDYHLGQVLYTGSDFVIIDFEGEPARSLAERQTKRSPLQDVAGMMRSFEYAAFAPLLGTAGSQDRYSDLQRFAPWAEAWCGWATGRFLKAYFDTSGSAIYLPPDPDEATKLLKLHLLEKAIYELGYELNNRPNWVGIPLKGISRLLGL